MEQPKKKLKKNCLWIMGIFIFLLSGCTPEPVSNAKTEIELHYINYKIYYPVDCRTKKVDNDYYVLCGPVGSSKTGGLYLIKGDSSGHYQIFAVNGKAKTHAEKGLNVNPISENIDISKILDAF